MSKFLDVILDLQYEAQHFGLHPRNILDSVYNIFFENLSTALMNMKDHLIEECKQAVPAFVIIKQTDALLQELTKVLDKCIDKLEVYLTTNVLYIEPHVVLPEDQVHIKNPCTKEEDEKLDSEIEELKQKILVEKAKRFCLRKKINEQREIKDMLCKFQQELNTLLTTANQEGVTPESIESLYSDLMMLLNRNIPAVKTEEIGNIH